MAEVIKKNDLIKFRDPTNE